MEKISLNAYLMYNGNCREAMEFYKSIFGGTLNIMTFGQTDPNTPDPMKDKVMHSDLMGGEVELMACDYPNDNQVQGNTNLALSGYDDAKLRGIFDTLSAGGTITVPLAKQMWGDVFGAFKDKFEIDWMVNIRTKKE